MAPSPAHPAPVPRPGPHARPAPPGLRVLLRLLLALALSALWLLAPPPAGAEGSGRWQWPVPAPHPVLRAFEAPEHRYGSGHRGIDIGVGAGAEVLAVEAGTVHFAGTVAGRGVVSVRHADGLLSTYEPVTASVAAGDAVGAGSVLGTIEEVPGGLSHCPGSSCLHLGARSGEDYLDPLLLLGVRGPSVLVRWDGAGSTAPGAGAALLGTGTTGGAVTGGVAGAGDGATSTVGPSAGSGRASGAASSPTRTGRAVPLHASSA